MNKEHEEPSITMIVWFGTLDYSMQLLDTSLNKALEVQIVRWKTDCIRFHEYEYFLFPLHRSGSLYFSQTKIDVINGRTADVHVSGRLGSSARRILHALHSSGPDP